MDVQKKDTAKCVKELFDRLERRLGKELLNRNATLKTVAFNLKDVVSGLFAIPFFRQKQ